MYSALKVNGKKLVDLARTGAVIERKPRKIDIHSTEVLSMNLPHIRLLVHCGKGTYIRRAVGPFRLENAKTLAEITELLSLGELERYIIPPDEMFDYPGVSVDTSYLVPAQNGNPIPAGKLVWGTPAEKPNSYHLPENMRQSLRKEPAKRACGK